MEEKFCKPHTEGLISYIFIHNMYKHRLYTCVVLSHLVVFDSLWPHGL